MAEGGTFFIGIMNKKVLEKLQKAAVGLFLCTTFFVFDAAAQTTRANSSDPRSSESLSQHDELQDRVRKSLKNPSEYVANLTEFINKYPYSERAASSFYSLKTVFKNTGPDETKSLIGRLIQNTEDYIPRPAKTEVYRHMADVLYEKGIYDEAAGLARRIIESFDEDAYLEYKKKQNETLMAELVAKNPDYKTRPFDTERTRGFFVGLKTNAYNLLAKSLWEQGKFEEAEKSYRDSLAIKVSKESALGIAKAAEKNGKEADTLKYATIAALTGKLDPTEMDYFYAVYAKRNQGKTDGVEEYLNAEFKKSYRNPVRSEKYRKTAGRSDRTVLVEFITGAGCIPCIPFDYTFEKVLEDYSRKEIALLVYHWHAPSMDPLGNHSSDSRVKYYGVNSAPNVFIDGKKFEADDSYYGGDGEQGEIQPIADEVNAYLKNSLEIPAGAAIKLKAERSGQKVSVNVDTDKLKDVSDDVTLQIALVENETAYSGENGLRFHPMVVRALAGDNKKRVFGFKVDPSKPGKFEYVFDVDKIVSQNFAYYDTQTSERMQEFLARVGGKMPEGINLTFAFNYKKNQIHSNHLSVIAFLQDNKTKRVLQSSVVSLDQNRQ